MNKKELIKEIVSKTSLKEEEVKEIYNEQIVNFKTIEGMDESEIESSAIKATMAKVKKHLHSAAEKFIGVVLGKSDITDFGAAKRYANAVELWKTDPNKAVKEQWVNEDGQPLSKNFANRLLDPATSRSRFVYLLSKKVEGGDKELKFTQLRLNYSSLDLVVPMGSGLEIEFRANVSEKSTDDKYVLNQANITEFRETGKKLDMKSLIKSSLTDFIVPLKDIEEWHDKHAEEADRLVVVKGDVADIRENPSADVSNILELNAEGLDFGSSPEENILVTCWVPKELSLNFYDYTVGLIVIGRTNRKPDTGAFSINVFGIIVPDGFTYERNDVKEEDVSEEHESDEDKPELEAGETVEQTEKESEKDEETEKTTDASKKEEETKKVDDKKVTKELDDW